MRAPLTQIFDVHDNCEVHLVGAVVAGDATLKAPLSGRQCVAYRVDGVRLIDHDPPSRETVTVACRAVAFFVEDDSGRAAIDASALELRLQHDHEVREPTMELRRVWDHPGGEFLRYVEVAVVPGQRVSTYGVATRSASAAPGGPYRAAGGEISVVGDAVPVIIAACSGP